jgi:hypothetical protein
MCCSVVVLVVYNQKDKNEMKENDEKKLKTKKIKKKNTGARHAIRTSIDSCMYRTRLLNDGNSEFTLSTVQKTKRNFNGIRSQLRGLLFKIHPPRRHYDANRRRRMGAGRTSMDDEGDA